MRITAFVLFCVLFGSFGNYPPPAEKIRHLPWSVSSQTETGNRGDQNQPKFIVTQTKENGRPGFAGRERHRAIRSKSSLVPHSGLSAAIPGRVCSPRAVSSFWSASLPRSVPSPTDVKAQAETSLLSLMSLSSVPPVLVFFTNTIMTSFVGEEHQQRQQEHQQRQSTLLPDSTAAEVCLSSEEKKLYDLIMAYRKSKRLPAIPYSAKLSKVAQTHVRDLEANYNYENASTCNPHSWSDKGTWTSCCYTSDHKVASCMWVKPKEIAGYEGSGYEIAYYSSAGANAFEGLEGWKKSQGHNPLIVNSGMWAKVKWQAIGIGIYGQYGVVWFGEEPDESKMKVCE